ncbi:TIGR01244 family sulfur transferase [Falsirhodobacter sp. alg1]|uniref:TIGR01244 family sulfur transferase n=1 Tax=Falsirhodobacter sp. alg1 TaxID=1472418 RepID=UPI0005EEF4F6|nr:TIGR01244 family sulfur transferase [Falsirhodobacter sp. alg1]
MDIRPITPDYAVSPQIDLEDLAALREAGYTTVIDNRPDAEIPPHLHTDPMQAAAEAAGLKFVVNPVIGGALTLENVETQRNAIEQSTGPVLAYCASGNRSSIVWALANAETIPVDDLIGLPARHGYDLNHIRPMIQRIRGES